MRSAQVLSHGGEAGRHDHHMKELIGMNHYRLKEILGMIDYER